MYNNYYVVVTQAFLYMYLCMYAIIHVVITSDLGEVLTDMYMYLCTIYKVHVINVIQFICKQTFAFQLPVGLISWLISTGLRNSKRCSFLQQ